MEMDYHHNCKNRFSQEITLKAEVYDDWFDVNVANELNKIIKDYGNENSYSLRATDIRKGLFLS